MGATRVTEITIVEERNTLNLITCLFPLFPPTTYHIKISEHVLFQISSILFCVLFCLNASQCTITVV